MSIQAIASPPPRHIYSLLIFLRKYSEFGIMKIGKLGVFELRPDSTHVPNVSTWVPKSRYPSKYVDDTWASESRPERARLCVHTTDPTGTVPLRSHREVVGSFRNGRAQWNGCEHGCPVAFRSRSGPKAVVWTRPKIIFDTLYRFLEGQPTGSSKINK